MLTRTSNIIRQTLVLSEFERGGSEMTWFSSSRTNANLSLFSNKVKYLLEKIEFKSSELNNFFEIQSLLVDARELVALFGFSLSFSFFQQFGVVFARKQRVLSS